MNKKFIFDFFGKFLMSKIFLSIYGINHIDQSQFNKLGHQFNNISF